MVATIPGLLEFVIGLFGSADAIAIGDDQLTIAIDMGLEWLLASCDFMHITFITLTCDPIHY